MEEAENEDRAFNRSAKREVRKNKEKRKRVKNPAARVERARRSKMEGEAEDPVRVKVEL